MVLPTDRITIVKSIEMPAPRLCLVAAVFEQNCTPGTVERLSTICPAPIVDDARLDSSPLRTRASPPPVSVAPHTHKAQLATLGHTIRARDTRDIFMYSDNVVSLV